MTVRTRVPLSVLAALVLCTSAAYGQNAVESAAPGADAPVRSRVVQPAARKKPFADLGFSAASVRDSLVAMARAQVGRRYVLGGSNPLRGFDCSGLVKYLAQAFDVSVPRTANQQAALGREVPKRLDALKPGDLLTFGSKKRVTHIGIYIGDGRYVHASTVAGRVVEREFDPNRRGQKPWVGVRRLFALQDSAASDSGGN